MILCRLQERLDVHFICLLTSARFFSQNHLQVPPPTRTDLVHQALADQILFHPAAGCDGKFTELEGLMWRNFIVLGIAGRILQRYTIYTVLYGNNAVHIVHYSEHTLPASTRGLHLHHCSVLLGQQKMS